MANLSTTYLGLHLKNPIVASASPLTSSLEDLKRLEEAGAAAVVLPSLFEEQVRISEMVPSHYLPEFRQHLPKDLQHIPDMDGYNQGVSGYLVRLYHAKKDLKIPVIASLNAYRKGGWSRYARILESSGADALELNVYYLSTRPQIGAVEVEEMYLNMVKEIKSALLRIPVAVKLNPFFTAPANLAQRLVDVGVNGLVLFNRFYQPDFNIETQTIEPSLSLSSSAELRMRLRWVALLSNQIKTDYAITGGVHTAEDVVKSLMAGANVAMTTSALLKNGISYLDRMLTDLEDWLDQHDIVSLDEIRGCMSRGKKEETAALERANYMNVLSSFERTI
ncbi:MAG: dihydroorotate dehydrogenase-like protein [Candidatus Promineifilaceae bacterium]